MSVLLKRRVAVISDLHVGHGARALDFFPYDVSLLKDRLSRDQDFMGAFTSLCQDPSFFDAGPIDALCVTGDISHVAHPLEFVKAEELIQQISGLLKVTSENVFYVPGNHDVSWAIQPWRDWDAYRYAPLLDAPLMFYKRMKAATTGQYGDPPFFVGWNTRNMLVVGINTAAYDTPNPPTGFHHGLVKEETLLAIDNFCNAITSNDAQLRVFLLHHHPVAYSDPRPHIVDPSTVVNAGNLRALLSKQRFDLVIHGHKHWPHIGTHMDNNQWPLNILGAGSFSALPNSQWTGEIANQFHIVEISGRDAIDGFSPGLAFGHVETWAYQIRGRWVRSNKRIGLRATEGFGSIIAPPVVERMIGSALDAADEIGVPCDWDQLIAASPQLRHVNVSVLHQALTRVANTRTKKFKGDVDSDPTDWVIY